MQRVRNNILLLIIITAPKMRGSSNWNYNSIYKEKLFLYQVSNCGFHLFLQHNIGIVTSSNMIECSSFVQQECDLLIVFASKLWKNRTKNKIKAKYS